jgi:hypothetical protein
LHRSRSHRQRLKERVQRRYRIRPWRRVVVGLFVLVAAGLVVAVYFIRPAEPQASAEAPPGESLTEPRLIGSWQSDADSTIAELRRTQPIGIQQEQDLRKHSFKTKVTYTDKMIATEVDRVVEMLPYQVVSKEGDEVVIKAWISATNQDEEVRIRFVGSDRYWLEAKQFGLTECFRRVR